MADNSASEEGRGAERRSRRSPRKRNRNRPDREVDTNESDNNRPPRERNNTDFLKAVVATLQSLRTTTAHALASVPVTGGKGSKQYSEKDQPKTGAESTLTTQSSTSQAYLRNGVIVYALVGLSIGLVNYALAGSMLGSSEIGAAIVGSVISLVIVYALPMVSMAMAGLVGFILAGNPPQPGRSKVQIAGVIAGGGHLILYLLGYGITTIHFLDMNTSVGLLDGLILNVLFALQAAAVGMGVVVFTASKRVANRTSNSSMDANES